MNRFIKLTALLFILPLVSNGAILPSTDRTTLDYVNSACDDGHEADAWLLFERSKGYLIAGAPCTDNFASRFHAPLDEQMRASIAQIYLLDGQKVGTNGSATRDLVYIYVPMINFADSILPYMDGQGFIPSDGFEDATECWGCISGLPGGFTGTIQQAYDDYNTNNINLPMFAGFKQYRVSLAHIPEEGAEVRHTFRPIYNTDSAGFTANLSSAVSYSVSTLWQLFLLFGAFPIVFLTLRKVRDLIMEMK